MAGRFITFEGPEGSGKSTQVSLLHRHLHFDEVREPGSTWLGDEVRDLLLHRGAMSAEAEMYLFMAARAELLARVIRPALVAGRVVVSDRYHDSTRAYQGARGVQVEWPAQFPRPDLTILLQVDPSVGRERLARTGRAPDRIEAEPEEFHGRVMEEYLRIAAAEPGRFLVLDGTREPAQIADRVWDRVRRLPGVEGAA